MGNQEGSWPRLVASIALWKRTRLSLSDHSHEPEAQVSDPTSEELYNEPLVETINKKRKRHEKILTWAGSMGDREGSWPRLVASIALRKCTRLSQNSRMQSVPTYPLSGIERQVFSFDDGKFLMLKHNRSSEQVRSVTNELG
ncbi:hypothetical protein Q3G72_034934 [Acer saccharum]|nr:hypothetical protein Q3G72_034934 [Acer saccharum]